MEKKSNSGWEAMVACLDTPGGVLKAGAALIVAWGIGLKVTGAEDLEHAVSALAVLAGGVWALYQFVLRRAFESGLSIDVAVSGRATESTAAAVLVQIDVTLSNTGNRRISSPPQLTPEQIAGFRSSIRYPADLQVMRIRPVDSPNYVGWWYGLQRQLIARVPELPDHIHLLYEYSRSNGDSDFFMEPGEKYTLGNTFVLEPGDYIAKIVFVGSRAEASEFWSRIVSFRASRVPQ